VHEKTGVRGSRGLPRTRRAANPLDVKLRGILAIAHTGQGASQVQAGKFEAARASFRAALQLREGSDCAPILCRAAACEFAAGDNAKAEELLTQARAEPGQASAVPLLMLALVSLLKLHKSLKKRFDAEFKQALAGEPTADGAAALAVHLTGLKITGVKYVGQKTHEKKVLTFLGRIRPEHFTEEQLQRRVRCRPSLGANKLLATLFVAGQNQVSVQPLFLAWRRPITICRVRATDPASGKCKACWPKSASWRQHCRPRSARRC